MPWRSILAAALAAPVAWASWTAAQTQPAPSDPALPANWLSAWHAPAARERPLQIVHGISLGGQWPPGLEGHLAGKPPDAVARAVARFFQTRGLGGLVCNVAFDDYLRSEDAWRTLTTAVEACRDLGLVVWIYDEEGYPSGAAGGLVLRAHPEYEATALAYDPTRPDPFVLRPAYEHTHASNNYYAARRYINLLDDRAVQAFLESTHEAYWKRLGPHFGTTIEATFTDEPSLIAVNLGQLPDEVRKRVRVVDPLDPSVKPLPSVPWCDDLAEQYRHRYGEDLLSERTSLFVGDTDRDRNVRRQFWALVSDLVAQRYFGALQAWCRQHRVASSGHTLWEEALMHHPALEGNAIQALARMDIPGLDMLSSDPGAALSNGWVTAGLPSSAALLAGRRRVMTEVSDFSQKMAKLGPASLAQMRAAAAWQAAWGVTDFTLYYSLADRSAADYRAYGDFIGRLNAVLKPAQWNPTTLLYYPVYDLWAEYKPVAQPLQLGSQSARAQRIVHSFMRLGQTLQRHQIAFAMIDHEFLAAASVRADGTLEVAGRRFRAVVLPEDVELPGPTATVITRFETQGGRVLRDGAGKGLEGKARIEPLTPAYRLAPPGEGIVLGQFVREHRPLLLAVNVGREAYRGSLEVGHGQSRAWLRMDPATGRIEPCPGDEHGRLPLALASGETAMLVGPQAGDSQRRANTP